jgi:hypothetical protein
LPDYFNESLDYGDGRPASACSAKIVLVPDQDHGHHNRFDVGGFDLGGQSSEDLCCSHGHFDDFACSGFS